jgi:hypothetical protein
MKCISVIKAVVGLTVMFFFFIVALTIQFLPLTDMHISAMESLHQGASRLTLLEP